MTWLERHMGLSLDASFAVTQKTGTLRTAADAKSGPGLGTILYSKLCAES
jgi:hypothetical protein